MIFLQSRDQFDRIGQLDPSTFHIEKYSKRALTNGQSIPIQGSFAEMQGLLTYLYREEGSLFFGLEDKIFEITTDTKAVIKRLDKERNQLKLSRGNNILLAVDYNRPKIYPPLGLDPTPFAEEEDYDFYLFVCNVLSDKGRRDRIYR